MVELKSELRSIMMIKTVSVTCTEADSSNRPPVLSKCHQRLIKLYVVYHGTSVSQTDRYHLLLRRL